MPSEAAPEVVSVSPFYLLGVLMAAAWARELALLRSVATVLLLL